MSHYQKFIEHFRGNKTFQLFGDSKKLRPIVLENPDPCELTKRNNEGYGVYLCINETDGGGRKASNIKRVRAVFADLDGVSPAKMMDYMPHLAVKSSEGKYHGYWFVDYCFPLNGFRGVQKSIAHCFSSDPVVHDLPRVMRVPGFYHLKADPVRTEVVWVNDDQSKLSYADCVEKFPPVQRKKWSSKKIKPSRSEDVSVGYTVTELLDRYGWTFSHGSYWTRPGKSHGVSCSILESGMAYIFTSSTCLKPNAVADAFEIMAQYEFNGSKSECMKKLNEVKR